MALLPPEIRKILLDTARSTIKAALKNRDPDIKIPESAYEILKGKRGCFVTLHIHGELRGCIGSIEPVASLIEGVESNAINAAFRDPRFPPLRVDELEDVKIEISVLTVPRVLEFTDGEDLKSQLRPGIHGVILSHGWHSSTFLPQVWEQLPGKEMFLSHLCLKGGMGQNCWQDTETVVKVYEAEYFSE